jgi:hypothetical protein
MSVLVQRSPRFWLRAIVGVLASVVVWYLAAYPRGMLMAGLDDGACGHDAMLTAGKPPYWQAKFRRLLQEKHGVTVEQAGDCMASPALRAYISGYNAVSRARLVARFGIDVFAECDRLAQQTWGTGNTPAVGERIPNRVGMGLQPGEAARAGP